jgi:hypothetical protein
MGEIDISVNADKHKVTLAPTETPKEEQARLAREAKDADHERRKDFIAFFASIVILAGVMAFLVYLVSAHPSEKVQLAGVGLLSSTLTGVVGYTFGKRASK